MVKIELTKEEVELIKKLALQELMKVSKPRTPDYWNQIKELLKKLNLFISESGEHK